MKAAPPCQAAMALTFIVGLSATPRCLAEMQLVSDPKPSPTPFHFWNDSVALIALSLLIMIAIAATAWLLGRGSRVSRK